MPGQVSQGAGQRDTVHTATGASAITGSPHPDAAEEAPQLPDPTDTARAHERITTKLNMPRVKGGAWSQPPSLWRVTPGATGSRRLYLTPAPALGLAGNKCHLNILEECLGRHQEKVQLKK